MTFLKNELTCTRFSGLISSAMGNFSSVIGSFDSSNLSTSTFGGILGLKKLSRLGCCGPVFDFLAVTEFCAGKVIKIQILWLETKSRSAFQCLRHAVVATILSLVMQAFLAVHNCQCSTFKNWWTQFNDETVDCSFKPKNPTSKSSWILND